MEFTYEYRFVDALPLGALVARRDEAGWIVVYLSRSATEAQLTEGLAVVQRAASEEYVCRERHTVAS